MSRRGTLLLAAALAAGCVAAPLGDDWRALAPAQRDARAVEALRALFAARVDGVGQPVDDRQVLRVDLEGVEYEAEHGASRLAWADVEAIEQDDHPDLPARPVDLRLYVRVGSPSEATVADLVEPTLVATGLFRRYVVLRLRPLGARARLVAALEHLRGREPEPDGAAAVASVASAAAPGPGPAPASREADLERKLRLLRSWRDEGLLSEEEYRAKRRALLDEL